MPHTPGISVTLKLLGATMMSHEDVPIILTSVPVFIPEPTAPRWASNAPTATGIPAGNSSLSAHVVDSFPAQWLIA